MVELEARLTWQRHLEPRASLRVPNGHNIADADVSLIHPRCDNVLAKATRLESG